MMLSLFYIAASLFVLGWVVIPAGYELFPGDLQRPGHVEVKQRAKW